MFLETKKNKEPFTKKMDFNRIHMEALVESNIVNDMSGGN